MLIKVLISGFGVFKGIEKQNLGYNVGCLGEVSVGWMGFNELVKADGEKLWDQYFMPYISLYWSDKTIVWKKICKLIN